MNGGASLIALAQDDRDPAALAHRHLQPVRSPRWIVDLERLWQWLLNDAYWFSFVFFLLSILAEELLAPRRRWRNRDDRIVYGQRADSPVDIRNGRSRPPPQNPPRRRWNRPRPA